MDPDASQIRIDAGFNVIPDRISVSKSAGTKLQWLNESSEPVLIVFYDTPAGLLVPAGEYSSIWQANPDASERPYEYKIKRPLDTTSTGTPPGSPAVDVGP